jgi:hypothetical protein
MQHGKLTSSAWFEVATQSDKMTAQPFPATTPPTRAELDDMVHPRIMAVERAPA